MKYMMEAGLLTNIKPLPKQHENDHTKKQEYFTNLRSNMDWNASSRTDKGVHSIANIFSCKVPESVKENVDWISELTNRFSNVEDSLRVFHLETIKEDAENFNSRKFGLWRTYEYFIPQYCLKGMISESKMTLYQKLAKKPTVTLPDVNLEAVCKQLNNVFSRMEGFKNFQNFTSNTTSNGSSEGGQEDDLDTFQNSDTVGNQYHRTVFQCFAKPYTIGVPNSKLQQASGLAPISSSDALRGVLIKVTASGFLYHQIRKMVGLAISHLIFPKEINDEFIDIAINSKETMFIPTAPGDSLILLHTALRDSSMENRIYGNSNSSKRSEFYDGCTNKEMEQFRIHHLYPEILTETPASFIHVQSYLNSEKKQEEKKNQKSSWIQLAQELKFYLKDLIEQKEHVKARAKKQIEESKRRDEWKKKEERERRMRTTIGENTELLPSGYKLHFYIKFKCLPNEEKSTKALNILEQLYRSKEIPIEETNFETLDQILISKLNLS
ncbi:predicted protein [Naegleria gruberi]|uniref:tRNA pseudouridine synthase n=1 Tax=Naegleria gruberi TaxID=5762 RepID=D2VPZ9_NAEGR|nr:uncharacterized protein NAEGRDRAFT_71112 [Naegleria gruberi]EFC41020.1 predicted protein [Naegleria gruberi]|eukprot:XP_002673764.1 predicted protein [Naegleria gruberi strain NEG-M]